MDSKKRLELLRVQLAKEEMKVKIEDRMQEIDQLRKAIVTQEAKEKELLEEMGKNG